MTNESSKQQFDSSPETVEALLRGINELADMTPQDSDALPEDSGALFLAPWEATIFAIVVSLNKQGHFSWKEWVDFFSTEIENATAAGMQTHGPAYYLLWLTAAEKLLMDKGLLMEAEYTHAKSAFALEHPHPCIHGLMQEHEIISTVLNAFDRFAQGLEKGDGKVEKLPVFIDFFTAFVDRLHDEKEEKLLFKAMTSNGFPEDGPIAVMCDEHVQASDYLAELNTISQSSWNRQDRKKSAHIADRYIQLLRQHISKENADLYPAAHAKLSEQALTELDRVCDNYDDTHQEERSRLRTLADDLNCF